ncbi:MAG: response regulator [Acidobacteriota bacterium]|nr:response regulator [Acidobacteriota bacterium]
MKGEFLASLNHEIRTPLSGVLGMVDLLLETSLTGEQKEYVDDARLCAENLLAILNATLEFSALSAGQVTLEEGDFSLRAMLSTALTDFGNKATAKGLRLTAHFAPDVPEIAFGDALRLQQILVHVVGNAIKFTPRGEVAIEIGVGNLAESDFLLTLNICDTGIGISGENLSHIFESFRQVETGLARRYTGMGLGLAVTRKLVTLLHGEVAVKSRLGEGTQFWIGIPLKTAREQVSVPRTSAPPTATQILIVEDNRVAQTVARHVLKRRAYDVATVSNGAAAVDAAREAQYSLILMDLQLPDMDGLETALQIRNLPGYAKVPIVALTANYSQEYRDMCFNQGLQGFLAKPVQSSELLDTVEKLLAASNAVGGLLPEIARSAA